MNKRKNIVLSNISPKYFYRITGNDWFCPTFKLDNTNSRQTIFNYDLFLTALVPCMANPCANGGTCMGNSVGGYICQCPVEFTGPTCRIGKCLFICVIQLYLFILNYRLSIFKHVSLLLIEAV